MLPVSRCNGEKRDLLKVYIRNMCHMASEITHSCHFETLLVGAVRVPGEIYIRPTDSRGSILA